MAGNSGDIIQFKKDGAAWPQESLTGPIEFARKIDHVNNPDGRIIELWASSTDSSTASSWQLGSF